MVYKLNRVTFKLKFYLKLIPIYFMILKNNCFSLIFTFKSNLEIVEWTIF